MKGSTCRRLSLIHIYFRLKDEKAEKVVDAVAGQGGDFHAFHVAAEVRGNHPQHLSGVLRRLCGLPRADICQEAVSYTHLDVYKRQAESTSKISNTRSMD